MRIVFAGGKNVGCGCLEYLLAEAPDTRVVAVLVNSDSDVAPDRWYRSAAELALKHGIPVFAPTSINAPSSVELLEDLAPDMIVVVYYDQILEQEVIQLPKRGAVNLHMALAEEYRGCYPTTWALINDGTRTGVTLHYIDEGIDSGDIIAQSVIPITDSDTGKSLYDKCTDAGIKLFKRTWPEIIAGVAPRRPQKTTERTRYYRRDFPSREVDFSKSGREIYNYIRAMLFKPFPTPYFYIGDKKVIIVEVDEESRNA